MPDTLTVPAAGSRGLLLSLALEVLEVLEIAEMLEMLDCWPSLPC